MNKPSTCECEGHILCSRCGRRFEPTDGRNTVCPDCRAPKPLSPISCGGCERTFTPTDGRQKYCPECTRLPIEDRKRQMRKCPTCGTWFFPTHGPFQLHDKAECAWPSAWNL